MSGNAAALVELITGRLEKGLKPLIDRVKKLEALDERVASLDARLRQLEAAARTPIEPDSGDGLGGA
jgi:hypothetical protein